MDISNIDDLLMGGKTSAQPEAPEHRYSQEPEPIEEMEQDVPDSDGQFDYDTGDEPQDDHTSEPEHAQDDDEKPKEEHADFDEYGNEKPKPRMYSQEEVNEMFRRRLKNKPEAEQQAIMQQAQQATNAGFEFDPNSEQSLPQQLQRFVEQTVETMTSRKENAARQAQEQQDQQAFQDKFSSGMDRFNDFLEVAGSMPIDTPMTLALRGMSDPAAFIYAAAKRHPQELERISKIRDPYAKITEMGKLEERMRRNKPTTQAPRPLGRAKEDTHTPAPKKAKESTIEDLIARSDARKLQQLKARRGR